MRSRGKWAIVIAIVAGGVLVVGGLGWIVGAVITRPESSAPEGTVAAPSQTAPGADTPGHSSTVVDESFRALGMLPEPITQDPAVYGAVAILAPATFDTTKTTREQFLNRMYTWMSPMPRGEGQTSWTAEDRAQDLDSSKTVLATQVVYPRREWDTLAEQKGRSVATLEGAVTVEGNLRYDPSGTKYGISGRVKVTYTAQGPNGEYSWDDTVDVQLLISCGPGSESDPAPNTAQRTGDCKVGHWVGR
ncbi:hypothetical protein [Microbacterium sp. SLBN-111]|uniref:hypothetical protein n=1 Tax=Microbacterium sp. SLBN-111 TaxID=3377733 RepID=UPI003C77BA51